MRSLLLAFIGVGVGCSNKGGGDDSAVECAPGVTYESFAHGFFLNWCTSCHSAALKGPVARAKAPEGVNFDTYEDVVEWSNEIELQATGDNPVMPPSGGPREKKDPALNEREILRQWIECGMPER